MSTIRPSWLVLGFLICVAHRDATAAADAYEDFAYPAGGALTTQNGGQGWNNAWAVVAMAQDAKIANVGLAFGALDVGGRAASTAAANNTTQDVRSTTVQAGGNGTTKYLSFLMKPKGPAQNPGSPFGGLFWGPLGNSLYVGRTQTTNKYCLSSGAVGGMFDGEVCSNTAPALNTTVFLVVKVVFQQGNDMIHLFVDPQPGVAEPAAADATKNDLNLDAGGMFQAVALHSKSDWDFDEIRVGPTFVDVTPAVVAESPCEVGGLQMEKSQTGTLAIRWSPAHTVNAIGYGIYQGGLGSWSSHAQIDCTDDGEDFREVIGSVSSGDAYYLVVPRNVVWEGSYGRHSDGTERPPGTSACAPQMPNPTCHFQDETDVGDAPFTAGCHYQFADALCTINRSFFSGDECTTPSPDGGFLDLNEWTNQACHPDEDDVKIHYCDAECRAMGNTSGHCESVANACGIGNASAKCVCVP